jgi:hypothetical protein
VICCIEVFSTRKHAIVYCIANRHCHAVFHINKHCTSKRKYALHLENHSYLCIRYATHLDRPLDYCTEDGTAPRYFTEVTPPRPSTDHILQNVCTFGGWRFIQMSDACFDSLNIFNIFGTKMPLNNCVDETCIHVPLCKYIIMNSHAVHK